MSIEMAAPGRLFIADAGLESALGHHLSYTAAIASAALDQGLGVVVLANRRFSGTLDDPRILVRRAFETRYQNAGAGGRVRRLVFAATSYLPEPAAGLVAPALRSIRRRLRPAGPDGLGAELAAALREFAPGPADHVLLHSASGANLASLAAIGPLGGARYLIVLRRLPWEMEADDPAQMKLPALLRCLDERFGPNLALFADTEDLAARYSDLAGRPVHPAPLPLVVPDPITRDPGPRPHVLFAGGARLEKGYHLLPAAIEAARRRARFTVQSGVVDAMADPLVQRAHRALRAGGGEHLTLIEKSLDPPDYAALLASADLLFLPYDGEAYGGRSSGILAEGLALGIPAVVPAGCWMEQAAGPERAIVMRPDGATEALGQALDALPRLLDAARAGAPTWRARHNPAALLDVLLAKR